MSLKTVLMSIGGSCTLETISGVTPPIKETVSVVVQRFKTQYSEYFFMAQATQDESNGHGIASLILGIVASFSHGYHS